MYRLILTSCMLAAFPRQVDDDRVLGDGLHNATYDVDWKSRVEQRGPKSWRIHHTLHNQKPGWVRVTWGPDVYDGWLEQTEKPKRVGGPDLDVEPKGRDSKIAIGDRGFQATPRHYDLHQTVGAKSVASEISVTLKVQDKYETVNVRATSKAQINGFSYELQLLNNPKLADSVKFNWKAAESTDLKKAIINKYGEGSKGELIRLDAKGAASFQVDSSKEPQLKSGPLVITDADGKRLGAVHAPALVPKE